MEYGTGFELNLGYLSEFGGFILRRVVQPSSSFVRSRKGHLGLVMDVVDKVFCASLGYVLKGSFGKLDQ